MLGVPKTILRFNELTRRIHKTKYIGIVTAMIYCSEKMQSKISKGIGAWDKVQRNLGASFQESFPIEVPQMQVIFLAMSCKHRCEIH